MATGNVFADTLSQLQVLSLTHEAVLVGFSGGKDSLVVLDMCVRTFKRVVPFFLYYVPGLALHEAELSIVQDRWGLDLLQYPHPNLFRDLANGLYGWESYKLEYLLERPVTMFDLYELIAQDTGIEMICSGHKKADGRWRRRQLQASTKIFSRFHMPLLDWNKWDVLAYCQANTIPVPKQSVEYVSASVGLSGDNLAWLSQAHPKDFEMLCRLFPFADAKTCQQLWYGRAKGRHVKPV